MQVTLDRGQKISKYSVLTMAQNGQMFSWEFILTTHPCPGIIFQLPENMPIGVFYFLIIMVGGLSKHQLFSYLVFLGDWPAQ